MNRYQLLVFDWDGTISNSAPAIVESIRLACADIGQPVPAEERARYVIGLGLADAIRHVAPDLPPEHYPRLADRYRHHYLMRDHAVGMFAGIADLLDELDRRGFLLAVATGKSRRGLDRALADTGLAHRFAGSRCADEGFPKPHPDMLLHLMDDLAVAREATLMIGDTTHDLELARNAGVDAVAVSYGAHGREALVALAPLAAVDSVPDLRDWLLALEAPAA